MSEPDIATGSDTGAGNATPDVSGASSTPTPDNSGNGMEIFVDQNFDKEFGLDPEPVTPDVPAVTDPPATHQGTEVEKKESAVSPPPDDSSSKPADTPADPAAGKDKEAQFAPNEKLNWDDDKVPFREEYNALKEAYLQTMEGSVESQFLTSPVEFTNWMKEASPTSYNEVGKALATESADTHPKEWIEYFAAKQPDLLAEIVTGRKGMTADRLNAELSIVLDEDDEDVQARLALMKKGRADEEAAKPDETPEQKELREIREERRLAKHQAVVKEVFGPVENAVDSLVSQAGLEIKEADYEGKDFAKLDEDTQFKVIVNSLIPQWIDLRVSQDPKLVGMQDRLQKFIAEGDVASAKKLQHQVQIVATNFTNEFLSLVTGRRAKSKIAETLTPANELPKPMVKGAGAGSTGAVDLTAPLTPDDWTGA